MTLRYESSALAAIVISLLAVPMAAASSASARSAATITASFADSCRDFAAHSSKDISHVVIHYRDGRVAKDERISSHDYTIDGSVADEIEFVIVKSGTTSQQFDCVADNVGPTALLEIETPAGETSEGCYPFFSGGLICEQSSPRTAWTIADDVPDTGGSESGLFHWGCGALGDRSECSFTFRFRGIGSSDPDGDITTWSLDFGDGLSASGSWSLAAPDAIAHDYSPDACGSICVITLTVTDSAGQSDAQVIRMVFVDQAPD